MYYSTGIFIDFQQFLKITAILQTKHFRNYSKLFLRYLNWTSSRKFRKSHPNLQKPMYYSTGILLIFSDILKITAILKRNMASDKTTPNFSGVPKERFGQVSKIPKIAPKLKKPMYYSTGINRFSATFLKPMSNETWASENGRDFT